MDERNKYDNRTLFRALSDGDPKALEAIYDVFRQELARYLRRSVVNDDTLADDVLIELLEEMWEKRETFADREDPISWMFGMARRLARYRQRSERHRFLPLDDIVPLAATSQADDPIISRELEQMLAEAIAELPPREQMIFRLKREEALDNDAIAERTGLSIQTVKNELTRAVKKIRQFMGYIIAYVIIELLKPH